MRTRTLPAVVAIGIALLALAPTDHVEAQAERGGMRLTVSATPETASTIEPFVSLDGVDVFATNCAPLDDVASYASEAVYECVDLELAVYDVGAPPIDGVEQALVCSPVGSFDGFDFSKADVSVDGYVYCSLSVHPPGVRFELSTADPATAVDDLVILDRSDSTVDVDCRRAELDNSAPWLHCDPLPLGTYTVPDQAVDASGDVQSFSCSIGIGISVGPGTDNTFTLEHRRDEFDQDFSVWSCLDQPSTDPQLPTLTISIDGDPAIVDGLDIELRQNGVDVRGDSCTAGTSLGYLDSGLDGDRSFDCRGEWNGSITPVVTNAPDTHIVDLSCYEQNPVSGASGDSAIFTVENNIWWICSLHVLEPSILVVAPEGVPPVDTLTLSGASTSGLVDGTVTLECRRDERGSAGDAVDVSECAPLPVGTFSIAPLVDSTGGPVDLDCFSFRSLSSSESGGRAVINYDGSATSAFWTCIEVDPLLDGDDGSNPTVPGPVVDGELPITGADVPPWLAPLALLLIALGLGLVRAGRAPSSDAPHLRPVGGRTSRDR